MMITKKMAYLIVQMGYTCFNGKVYRKPSGNALEDINFISTLASKLNLKLGLDDLRHIDKYLPDVPCFRDKPQKGHIVISRTLHNHSWNVDVIAKMSYGIPYLRELGTNYEELIITDKKTL